MAREAKSWKERFSRLQDSYRLIIRNNETFSEVGSYNLTLLNLYIFTSVAFILAAILVYLMLGYTPMRRIMPGYGETVTFQEAYELNKKLNALEEQVGAQNLYINSFKGLLIGQVDTSQVEDISEGKAIFSGNPTPRIKEDDILRRKVNINPESSGQSIGSNMLSIEQMYLIAPLKGFVSAEFEYENGHLGIDIGAPADSPIKTIADGVVVLADWTLETGNTIGVQHSSNVISFYKHNSSLLKKVGDRVQAGEAIAIIGNTGTLSSGPHLHFELWNNGKVLDPSEFIDFSN